MEQNKDINRLKLLVVELERLEQSPQPYARNEALQVLAQIECQANIIRPHLVEQMKRNKP